MKKFYQIMIANALVQNEQQKALQTVSAFRAGIQFGGTSVTSLITLPEMKVSLAPKSYEELADIIAEEYKKESDKIFPKLRGALSAEEVDLFAQHGLFFGIHISPKLLGITEKLVVTKEDLLLPGFPDPYELPRAEPEKIDAYFRELREKRGMNINSRSLILSDTTTPKELEGKRILNPIKLNDKLSTLSTLIQEAGSTKGLKMDAPYVLCTDSDSNYRISLVKGVSSLEETTLTPGLTPCGSTAKMEDFDFLYFYRMGLIAQLLSNNIIASKIRGIYNPFTFYGMLSPYGYKNGAINPGKMGNLRYPGDIDLIKEFEFLVKAKINRLIPMNQ